ncbi:MAG: leucine--tRNA ligase [Clostridiales bacterium]|nr:leucine--tRNA ligase [Clostridiales bacterium]
MDMKEIEAKWQARWEKDKLAQFNRKSGDKKHYVLEMFSYPSGAKLHVGHWYNYGPTDTFARYKKMKGYNVFQPMGFDAFGLPAENFAIKTGIHPKDSTEKNIATMEQQLKAMGGMFDWSAEIKTCEEEYYKWTQWMFVKLYENGLAYRKEAPVNWCSCCNTVLANEQVIQGKCERCDNEVTRKNLTQWFFRITKYAEELLTDLEKIDWPEKTVAMQRNWIGKSVGGEVEFATENGEKFRVFTTRADTLFGVSYVVLAPEHPLVDTLTTESQKAEVEAYRAEAAKATEIDRLSSTREKTGVFTGAYVINPINNKKVPVYIADYVLASYGTGAVMGVPAHDERDFVFANKYGLPITRVIQGKGESELPYVEDGTLVGSDTFDGLTCEEGRREILKKLSTMGKGEYRVNYRLRDWLVSRQRYWGAPIPVIHCPTCGEVLVPEKDLPVRLPYDVEFKPDGKSPLAKSEEFMNCKCPKCGGDAKRDPDTLDTFVCSSWYFLRYADPHNAKMPFDPDIINEVLPVDTYVGGAEHACMHLLYARFFTKALRDMGYLKFDEPFKKLVHQGIILGPDGNRMSKSHGNVISPDTYIEQYGSDIFRLYLMFGFAYREGGPWNDQGILSVSRFLERVERLAEKVAALPKEKGGEMGKAEKKLDYARNYAIKMVDRDTNDFSFNTAVARIMEYVNALYAYDQEEVKNVAFYKECMTDLLLLLAPYAPHFTEELWEKAGNKKSVFTFDFPAFNESALVKDEAEYAVQLNSKMRFKITLSGNATEDEIRETVLADERAVAMLEGKTPKKIIVIKGRLVNVIA